MVRGILLQFTSSELRKSVIFIIKIDLCYVCCCLSCLYYGCSTKFWSLVSQNENILVGSVLWELFDPEEG